MAKNITDMTFPEGITTSKVARTSESEDAKKAGVSKVTNITFDWSGVQVGQVMAYAERTAAIKWQGRARKAAAAIPEKVTIKMVEEFAGVRPVARQMSDEEYLEALMKRAAQDPNDPLVAKARAMLKQMLGEAEPETEDEAEDV